MKSLFNNQLSEFRKEMQKLHDEQRKILSDFNRNQENAEIEKIKKQLGHGN